MSGSIAVRKVDWSDEVEVGEKDRYRMHSMPHVLLSRRVSFLVVSRFSRHRWHWEPTHRPPRVICPLAASNHRYSDIESDSSTHLNTCALARR